MARHEEESMASLLANKYYWTSDFGGGERKTAISLLFGKMQWVKKTVWSKDGDRERAGKRVKGQRKEKESREILEGGWRRTLFLGVPSRRGRGDAPRRREYGLRVYKE